MTVNDFKRTKKKLKDLNTYFFSASCFFLVILRSQSKANTYPFKQYGTSSVLLEHFLCNGIKRKQSNTLPQHNNEHFITTELKPQNIYLIYIFTKTCRFYYRFHVDINKTVNKKITIIF